MNLYPPDINNYLGLIAQRGDYMRLITVHVPEYYIEGLHELVRQKKYPHRSGAVRTAIRDLLMKELPSGFTGNPREPARTRRCSKCGTPLYLARDEKVYFCAHCKSFFSPESF